MEGEPTPYRCQSSKCQTDNGGLAHELGESEVRWISYRGRLLAFCDVAFRNWQLPQGQVAAHIVAEGSVTEIVTSLDSA